MWQFSQRLSNDESGIAAVEYVVMLALVGSTIIVGATLLGNVVGADLTKTATCIQSEGTTCT